MANKKKNNPEEKNIKLQDVNQAEETVKEQAEETAETAQEKAGEIAEDKAEEILEKKAEEIVEEKAEEILEEKAEEIVEEKVEEILEEKAEEALQPDVVEDAKDEKQTPAWITGIKDSLDDLAEKITKGGKKEEETAEEDDGAPVMPMRSKDDMQRDLAEMKEDFEHTPMQMTPELEKLLAAEIKADDKKDKKRGAQMLGVLANHNFYANGLTPEELRTTF